MLLIHLFFDAEIEFLVLFCNLRKKHSSIYHKMKISKIKLWMISWPLLISQTCWGAINGSHIRIVAPHEHPQVVCANNLQFLHVVADWPGSINDLRILRNCGIWNTIPDNYFVGDGSYPLRNWLLKSFRDNGHLTGRHRHFYYRLSSARACIWTFERMISPSEVIRYKVYENYSGHNNSLLYIS